MGRVRRQERERTIRVSTVLSQVKTDPADLMPGGRPLFEPFGEGLSRPGDLTPYPVVQLGPEGSEALFAQVLGARHGRGAPEELWKIVGRIHRGHEIGSLGSSAEPLQIPATQVPEEGNRERQRRRRGIRSQGEEAAAGAVLKGVEKFSVPRL